MARKKKENKDEELLQDEAVKNEAGNEVEAKTEEAGAEDLTQKYEQQISELNDKYLRLYSEFDNFRKRTNRERLDLFKTAGKDIIGDLLGVIDDFERALAAEEQDPKSMKDGMELIYTKMKNTLKNHGLSVFESTNKAFDPEFHEAITKIPAPSKKLKGKVVDEIEKGYMLHDKVLRYSKVVVGE